MSGSVVPATGSRTDPDGPWHIVGAGPVALACALFLVRRGVPARRLALDPSPSLEAPVPPALGARTLALSNGSRQLLERIAALPATGRIERVEVSMLGHAGRTRIDASDLGVTALGHVVRYDALLQSLRRAARAHRWADAPPRDPAALVIHAEGDCGEDASVREFDQSALLGEVSAPLAPPGAHATAFERFTPYGPLALLPVPEPGRWTLVWCDRDVRCRERLGIDAAALAAGLQQRFGDALGPLSIVGPVSVAALVRRARRQVVSGTEAWIGNAAQALHPVAGQGLNLGLRDAFELADALAPVASGGSTPAAALERWRRARRSDRAVTIGLTDLMATSFTWPLARPLQSTLLTALDAVAPLRRVLARRLMYGGR